jgi:hypothetical protein
MAKFGIDSNMVFDADGKSVAARLSDHDTQMADISINVKTLGAKGDGLTDDTIAIQNAINDCKNGGIVYIPKGVFLHTGLTIPHDALNLTIMGCGNASILKTNQINKDGLSLLPPAGGSSVSWVKIQNLQLDGGGFSGGTGNTLSVQAHNNVVVESCLIGNGQSVGNGLYVAGNPNNNYNNWNAEIRGCVIGGGFAGVYLATTSSQTSLQDVEIDNAFNQNYGIYIDNAGGAWFDNVHISNSAKNCVYIEGGGEALNPYRFSNCDFDWAGNDLVYINASKANSTAHIFDTCCFINVQTGYSCVTMNGTNGKSVYGIGFITPQLYNDQTTSIPYAGINEIGGADQNYVIGGAWKSSIAPSSGKVFKWSGKRSYNKDVFGVNPIGKSNKRNRLKLNYLFRFIFFFL